MTLSNRWGLAIFWRSTGAREEKVCGTDQELNDQLRRLGLSYDLRNQLLADGTLETEHLLLRLNQGREDMHGFPARWEAQPQSPFFRCTCECVVIPLGSSNADDPSCADVIVVRDCRAEDDDVTFTLSRVSKTKLTGAVQLSWDEAQNWIRKISIRLTQGGVLARLGSMFVLGASLSQEYGSISAGSKVADVGGEAQERDHRI